MEDTVGGIVNSGEAERARGRRGVGCARALTGGKPEGKWSAAQAPVVVNAGAGWKRAARAASEADSAAEPSGAERREAAGSQSAAMLPASLSMKFPHIRMCETGIDSVS